MSNDNSCTNETTTTTTTKKFMNMWLMSSYSGRRKICEYLEEHNMATVVHDSLTIINNEKFDDFVNTVYPMWKTLNYTMLYSVGSHKTNFTQSIIGEVARTNLAELEVRLAAKELSELSSDINIQR